ncbi:MAG: ATP-dependent helicase [Nanoarchaeota archaeon]
MLKTNYASERKPEEIDKMLEPLVKEWFYSRFKGYSLPQLFGVMPIHERKNILISAPTGGTKTLTAFLAILNYLVSLAVKNELEDKVYAIYVSPLKALSADIHVNLIRPLEEIRKIAEKNNVKMQEIIVGLRTGDTTASERQKMYKKTPHIIITTPESLAIMITTPKFVLKMRRLEYVVIDEIHALANKRGVHLSLSLERIEYHSSITPVRIGLSATVFPLTDIARFLVGSKRDCLIADVQFAKQKDIEIDSEIDIFEDETNEVQKKVYITLNELIQKHKTTLIFTNTRAATERVVHYLKDSFPQNYASNIGAHHSSLSKEHRFDMEKRLREGSLKVIVSSTSLELGIDIGCIDLVILLGSPISVARALQRIGRAGHKLYETAKGRFIVLDRDDLVECAVMTKAIKENKIDRVSVPKNCLDVLSQQVVGMSIEREWGVNEIYEIIKKSYCYENLKIEDFLDVISYLAGEYALEHRNVYAKIWYNEKERTIGRRSQGRIIYMTNVGTIPEESFLEVEIAGGEKSGRSVGKVDESFLEKLKPGDVFVLGGSVYSFAYTRGMKVYVRSDVNKSPTIPSWFSEMLPLSFDLACEIQRFRKIMEEKMMGKESPSEIKEFIQGFVYCKKEIAEKIYDYFYEQYKYAEIPHMGKIIAEFYRNEKTNVVFHSLFGRKTNDVLSRVIGFLVARLGGRDMEIGISDNGFYLSGEKITKEQIDKAIKHLTSENIKNILEETLENTEILKRRFRHCAARSFMILRNYKGRKKSVGRQQMSSSFMLHSVKKMTKNFPILREARREVMEEVMDIENAQQVVKWIKDNKIAIKYIERKIPSPFAHNLIMQGYGDLIKMESKIDFLKRLRSEILKEIGGKDGKQD